MSFFCVRKKLHPLVAIFASIVIVLTGLILARTWAISIFLAGVFVWLCCFGCARACFRTVIPCVIVSAIFFGITYGTSGGKLGFSFTMVNRLVAVFLAVVPGMSTEPVRMTRALSQVHTPRSVTLGMLITMSFVPMLKGETRRVREAMKTRGAGSLLNPKIFYRAFLVPFVMRLINISDTLALSVETRGFTLEKNKPYTIYKREQFTVLDLLFVLGMIAGTVGVAVASAFVNTALV